MRLEKEPVDKKSLSALSDHKSLAEFLDVAYIFWTRNRRRQ
jgi:hypothetical protein